ncbi:bile acid:sodium symporter family protein [Georgenia alba]|uniref:Bile acid:sodium symporter family protein n=1 Tax=Georgenia alba TaxID=2233858 RepID=A0ABW2QD63_9MICO
MRRLLGLVTTWIDPFVVALVAILVLGVLVPVPAPAREVVSVAGDVAVTILFFVYGMRLSTREVLGGLRNVRLQGSILVATYLVFPLIGIGLYAVTESLLGASLALGLLYLTLLPSTVQSSVSFTSIARGNVAGALAAATISNVLGMVLTPLLVLVVMEEAGSVGFDGLRSVLLHLLLPFVLGQLLQPFTGAWVRAQRRLTQLVDRGTILVVVLGAVTEATADGVWTAVSWRMLVALLLLCAGILAFMLAGTWWGGRALRLNRADRIAMLMCGSKKSLTTGLPMAAVLFPVATAAVIAVPVILFHQMQLIVCAFLARHLARRSEAAS